MHTVVERDGARRARVAIPVRSFPATWRGVRRYERMEREREQGTGNKEQGTGNKEQGTGNGRGRRKGDDIAERLLDAVEGVRRILPALQRDAASRHLAQQLWRAATGGGSNYEEARGAESSADFVHKIRVATKEMREAHY